MHEVTINKIFHGAFVSVRDHHVLKGSYSGGLIIRHFSLAMKKNFKMIVPADVCLIKYKQREAFTKVKSKYGTKPYYLIDFRWNPIEEDTRQKSLSL